MCGAVYNVQLLCTTEGRDGRCGTGGFGRIRRDAFRYVGRTANTEGWRQHAPFDGEIVTKGPALSARTRERPTGKYDTAATFDQDHSFGILFCVASLGAASLTYLLSASSTHPVRARQC